MYIKITHSGAQRYVQLVVSQRMEGQPQPKTKVIATLGRADMLKAHDVDHIINGLLRATGRAELTPEILHSLELPLKKAVKKTVNKT